MFIAFIAGVVIATLITFFYTKSITETKYMEMMKADNRLAQRLIDEQYKYGIEVGKELAKKEIPEVAYICDEKACETCNPDDWRYCHHTLDIRHAVNFTEVEPGKFMEKE